MNPLTIASFLKKGLCWICKTHMLATWFYFIFLPNLIQVPAWYITYLNILLCFMLCCIAHSTWIRWWRWRRAMIIIAFLRRNRSRRRRIVGTELFVVAWQRNRSTKQLYGRVLISLRHSCVILSPLRFRESLSLSLSLSILFWLWLFLFLVEKNIGKKRKNAYTRIYRRSSCLLLLLLLLLLCLQCCVFVSFFNLFNWSSFATKKNWIMNSNGAEGEKGGGGGCVVWTGLLTIWIWHATSAKWEILWATSSCGLWDLCVLLDSPTLLIKIVLFCPTPFSFHVSSLFQVLVPFVNHSLFFFFHSC